MVRVGELLLLSSELSVGFKKGLMCIWDLWVASRAFVNNFRIRGRWEF